MRQVTGLTSTYSSDEFGICSALYELGGMVVMHDASGCNSTYTTHDEPRWYDMDSMIFISAISEMEAIMGDDEKFIEDLTETAEALHPKFIALVGAPIPYMIGTDLEAIAAIVSEQVRIPCFAFSANGMHDYTRGVSMALERMVRAYALQSEEPVSAGTSEPCAEDRIIVNILGATPLDFSLNGSVDSIRQWISDYGMRPGACLSMGCTPEDIQQMGNADVNLVVSAGGLAAAEVLKERFAIPYVAGVPFGEKFSEYLAGVVRGAAISKENRVSYLADSEHMDEVMRGVLIGESVFSASLATAIEMEHKVNIQVLCPLETGAGLLRPGDLVTPEEDDLIREMQKADVVIADPLYQSLARAKKFYPLPHEAFSGRIYDSVNPNLIAVPLQ